MKLGTCFAVPRRAVGVTTHDHDRKRRFDIELADGMVVCARALVVATGVQYRRLPIEGLETFEGAGIYYAATEVEARYCRDTDAVIIGGGNVSEPLSTPCASSRAGHVAGGVDAGLLVLAARGWSQHHDPLPDGASFPKRVATSSKKSPSSTRPPERRAISTPAASSSWWALRRTPLG
ncbi:MAG: NAD(P)/FAD-dependent oxidoreductase [Rhodobacteraceae bacterium]|nr:NAD(P)/FAD-dependent oxidoreductase [Paracoccaceae bacterium]